MSTRKGIYIAGADTLMGRGLVEHLRHSPSYRLINLLRDEPNLCRQDLVDDFFDETRPDVVIIAAGASGGIQANQRFPADLMVDNLLVSTHLLSAARQFGVCKLLYLGSSCMYPAVAPQPLIPAMLGTGPLEPTNEAYATAKIAAATLCLAYRRQYGSPFIVGIPANVFGPHDDFQVETSHVIPALIRRVHDAKQSGADKVVVWGSGSPIREFVYVSDFARACLHLIEHYDGDSPINLAAGHVYSIAEIAHLIAQAVGYRGKIVFDTTRPDGMARKYLDSTELVSLGWKPTTEFVVALERTYEWFLKTQTTESSRELLVAV